MFMNLLHHRRLIYTVIMVIYGSFITGLILGISSSAVQQIKITQASLSLFSAIVNIGGMIGSLFAGQFLDVYGRKRSLLLACFPAILGWVLMLIARDITNDSRSIILFLLIFGRFLTGVAAGIYSTIAVPYLIEITHPESNYRGFIVYLSQLMIAFGMVFANGLGMFKSWPDATLLYLALTIFMFLLLVTTIVPDSPKWLLTQNLHAEADHCSKLLHGVTLYHQDLSFTGQQTKAKLSFWKTIFPCSAVSSSHNKLLGIALILTILQQLTGINALIFFTETICADSGASNPALCAFSITLAQFIFSFFACFVTDYLPKKLVLEVTGCIMAFALFSFAVALANEAKGYISLYCILVFFFGFSFGWGPLPSIVAMELFPTQLRGAVSAASLAINWCLSYFITQTFLSMTSSLGSSNVFVIYGLMCLASSSFVAIFLPEPPGSIHPIARLENTLA